MGPVLRMSLDGDLHQSIVFAPLTIQPFVSLVFEGIGGVLVSLREGGHGAGDALSRQP